MNNSILLFFLMVVFDSAAMEDNHKTVSLTFNDQQIKLTREELNAHQEQLLNILADINLNTAGILKAHNLPLEYQQYLQDSHTTYYKISMIIAKKPWQTYDVVPPLLNLEKKEISRMTSLQISSEYINDRKRIFGELSLLILATNDTFKKSQE